MSSRRTPRRGRRSRFPSDDDVPLSLLSMLKLRAPRTKKTTPRKRVARRMRTLVLTPPTPAVTRTRALVSTPPTPAEIISLDDGPETEAILKNIEENIGNFMETGRFISSDEDESEMIKTKSNKKTLPDQFFISDDSDDECSVVVSTKSNVDNNCEPSTSAGPSHDTSSDKILKAIDEMDLLPATDFNSSASTQNPLNDMKSLEDYRKETEEMLKNASSLLDEIKTGCKPQPKLEESPTNVTIGACPICLESLATRPASVTVCGHIFCKECITHTARTLKKCPTCRTSINLKKIHPIFF